MKIGNTKAPLRETGGCFVRRRNPQIPDSITLVTLVPSVPFPVLAKHNKYVDVLPPAARIVNFPFHTLCAMFPAYLLTDPGFWSFAALYVVSAIVVIYLLVWPYRRFATSPNSSGHLPLPRWLPIFFTLLLMYQFFHQAEHVTQMYQF